MPIASITIQPLSALHGRATPAWQRVPVRDRSSGQGRAPSPLQRGSAQGAHYLQAINPMPGLRRRYFDTTGGSTSCRRPLGPVRGSHPSHTLGDDFPTLPVTGGTT